jgi:hypothetical protein
MINITREQLFDFVKTEKDTDDVISKPTKHYLDYFDKYQSTGKIGNWNWAAFGLSAYWFFYRRMCLAACALISTSLLFSKIFEKQLAVGMENGDFLQFLPLLIFDVVLWGLTGFYSDYIYLHYASTKILKGKIYSGVNRKLKFVFWGLFIIVLIIAFIVGLIAGAGAFKTPS